MTISAIVPCFNEEKTVKNVINTLLVCPEVKEVIAVNDGSADDSLEILRSFGQKIKLINFKKNHGKAAAVVAGINKANGDLVFFVDADLIGLRTDHVTKMVDCLKKKNTRVVFGNLEAKGDISEPSFYYRILDKFTRKFIKYDFLTGERIYFKNDLLPLLPKMKNLGYGLEVFLNNKFKDKKMVIAKLSGAFQPPKEKKTGLSYQTFRLYFKEAMEISKELARQEGVKGKEALVFRNRFIREFLNKYVRQTKRWQKILKKYLDEVLGAD